MLKVKANGGRDVYYIFAKVETRKRPNGISDAVKQELLTITPWNYTGM